MKFLLVLATFVAVCAGKRCLPPFVELGSQCFYVENTEATFDEARTICKELAGDGVGGDLISLPNCDEYVKVSRYLELNGQKETTYWVGAKAVFAVNEWFWLSLDDLSTGVPFFVSGQGVSDSQNCAAMDGRKYWRLMDSTCTNKKPFVCSMPLAPVAYEDDLHDNHDHDVLFGNSTQEVFKNSREVLQCPEKTVQVGDHCYFFSDEPRSWTSSEYHCKRDFRDFEGHLYWPESCLDYTMMAHHIEADEKKRDYWIGAIDVDGDNGWTWVDGRNIPGGMPYWDTDYPNHAADIQANTQCGLMSKDKRYYMINGPCHDDKYSICKLHSVVS